MKRCLVLILGLVFCKYAHAEEIRVQDLSAGMYSYVTPNKIPDNAASYIQNFYTDIQPMAVERNGYVLQSGAIGSTNLKSVLGLWKFLDVNNNEWLIIYSSNTFYKLLPGGTVSSLGPVTTTSNIPRCATNLGKIMCVDGVDQAWTFDGTSTATVSAAPLGQLIAAWRTRFVIANIAGSQSTVDFSKDGDATTWALGPLDGDPFAILIGGANDGQYVRCMAVYYDDLIVARKYDTWDVSGFSQGDVLTRDISTEVGCIEPGSMREFDGSLMFLSWRGLEEMRGLTITKVSEPIRDLIDPLIKNTSNQRINTQTTQADWGAGTSDNNVYIDTETSPGDILPSYPDGFVPLRDGTGGTKKAWIQLFTGGASGTISNEGTAGLNNQLDLQNFGGVSNGRVILASANPLNNFQQGTTYHLVINGPPFNAVGDKKVNFYVVFSSLPIQGTTNPDQFSSRWYYEFTSSAVGQVYLFNAGNEKHDSVLVSTSGINLPFNFDFYLATTTFQYSINNIVINSGVHTWDTHPIYVYLEFENQLGGSTFLTSKCSNFGVTPETFTFTSQLMPIGTAITAWEPVTITDAKSGSATLTYQFGSTATANVTSITNYSSISNGLTPSISTNPFAAFNAKFSNLFWSDTSRLQAFVTTWKEGGIVSPVSGTYDGRYWLSFTTNSITSPLQDTVLIYQRNRTFTLFKGIRAASLSLWQDKLYFGDSNNTGNVYLFDVGNVDGGNIINSQINFKSYELGMFHRDKSFRRCYIDFLGNSSYAGYFNWNFIVDESTSSYLLGNVNMNDGTGQTLEKFPFPLSPTYVGNLSLFDTSPIQNGPVQGREIQFQLIKNVFSDRLKLYDFELEYQPMEAR